MPNFYHPFSKFLLACLEVVFIGRLFFKIFAFDKANPFVNFVYSTTDFFLAPFLFVQGTLDYGRHRFELAVILAMLVYFLIGFVIVHFVRVIAPKQDVITSAHEVTEDEDEELLPE